MTSSFRGALSAAFALLLAAGGAAWSNPSVASDGAPVVLSAHYLQHAAASADIGELGLNDFSAPPAADAQPARPAGPLSEHLVGLAQAALPAQGSLIDMVSYYAGETTDGRDQDCLAHAVYFEARGEPIEGQLAVAEVVLNRARSGRYPASICEVVTQPWQFSFVRRGVMPRPDRDSQAWQRAVGIARIALNGAARRLPNDVSPSWGRRLSRTTKIGLHIFYS